MDETATNTKNARTPACNQDTEPTGRKVLSRYLRGSPGSCHDNCKSGIKCTTETKPINPFTKRVSTAAEDRTHVHEANSAQKIKEDDAFDPKVQDLKRKPKPNSTPKPNPGLTKACSLPPLTIPRSRSSEAIVDSPSVLCMSPVGGSSSSKKKINKSGSRKSLKLSSVGTVSSSRTPGNRKSPRKVPTLRAFNSFPKLKDSRKLNPMKPIEEIPEKTMYVVEVNNGNDTAESQSPKSPDSSSSEEKILKSSQNESQLSSPSMEERPGSQDSHVADSRAKNKKKATRVRNLTVGNKDRGPVKLKFNRGKVIEGLSEGNRPRKLEFRQGKVLGEEQKADNQKRSLRRSASDGVSHSPKTHSVKVVLKHQGKREKKDPLRLFNNVIKETASKLIQTRKSKVKALVGAFENLITRNDAQTVNS